MSLDVYLDDPTVKVEAGERIFIRDDGAMKEISRAEWDARYPDREPVTVAYDESNRVYHANITHNLNTMAEVAGIYKELWHPDEIGVTHARQLIEPLTAGLERLRSDPAQFRAHNAPNGWGKYENLIEFVAGYLQACKDHPQAEVSVWR